MCMKFSIAHFQMIAIFQKRGQIKPFSSSHFSVESLEKLILHVRQLFQAAWFQVASIWFGMTAPFKTTTTPVGQNVQVFS